MKKKFIKDPIYESHFWFVWDTPVKELRQWVLKKYNYEIEVQDNVEELGKTIIIETPKTYSTIIWVNKKKNLPSLVHELLHKTFLTLKTAGFELTDESEEAYTYLLTYYLRECLEYYEWNKTTLIVLKNEC